jgi:hypothetical protein
MEKIMINSKSLKIDKILKLNSNEKFISLSDKIIKLAEELGDMQTAKLYFLAEDYIKETYDAFNISVATYHTVKDYSKEESFVDFLKISIDKIEPNNRLDSAIPIFYGKICASLLFQKGSHIKSRNIKDKDLEAYLLELILLLASQLKYIYRKDIDIDSIVSDKLMKWEEKQQEYV